MHRFTQLRTLRADPIRQLRVFVAAALSVLATTSCLGIAALTLSTSSAAAATAGQYGGGGMTAADPAGGYWVASWVGAVTSYGGAPDLGSPAQLGIHLAEPVVGIASTFDGDGYRLVATDGGVFTFGNAQFYGSTGSLHLNRPIVGMASTPDGRGYWLVASDGGIFSFGDAQFYGSTGSLNLNRPIVGMASTPDGQGYWLVASDGGIFTFGDAQFYGSTGSLNLNRPMVGMASAPDGQGYWLVASDGGIFTFGDAEFYGSLGGSGKTVMGMMINPVTPGYTLVESDGSAVAFDSGSNPASSGATWLTSQPESIGGGTQGADCKPLAAPTATVDQPIENVIDNESGPGWIGGDATYSTELPNGQESFVFSDTVIGTAQPDGSAAINGMPHNSELVGAMPDLNSDYGGNYYNTQTLIPDTSGNGDQWEVAATYVEGGNQLIFVNEFTPVPGSPYDEFTGRSGIAVMTLPSNGLPSYSSVTPVPTGATTQWGAAVTQSGGYTYIYGEDFEYTTHTFHGMKVARVAVGDSLDTSAWTYWSGTQWVSGERNAVPMPASPLFTGVTSQLGGSGFVAVMTAGGGPTGATIDLSYSCSPSGPWSAPQPVYSIPQVAEYPSEIAYIATFHPELSVQGGLVVSYNINSLNGLAAQAQDIHQYQPQFLQLSG